MIQPIQNVDVYPLLAHLLGVTPKPNNGTQVLLEKALLKSKEETHSYAADASSSIFSSNFVLVLFSLVLYQFH